MSHQQEQSYQRMCTGGKAGAAEAAFGVAILFLQGLIGKHVRSV